MDFHPDRLFIDDDTKKILFDSFHEDLKDSILIEKLDR